MGKTKKADRLKGIPKKELYDHVAEVEAVREAVTLPLPGPLGAAFANTSRKVCGIEVRCPVAIDFAILQGLDSPILRQMAEAAKPAELRQPTKFKDQDGWNMVYQFIHPAQFVEEHLSQGREHYERLARLEIGLKMNPFALHAIIDVIGLQLTESYMTALKYRDGNDGDRGKDFPAPPPAATASVGG